MQGVLQFDQTRFDAVAQTVQRWYEIKIILENKSIRDCVITGEFENEGRQRVMKALHHAIGIDYWFTTNGLSVSGEGCER